MVVRAMEIVIFYLLFYNLCLTGWFSPVSTTAFVFLLHWLNCLELDSFGCQVSKGEPVVNCCSNFFTHRMHLLSSKQ